MPSFLLSLNVNIVYVNIKSKCNKNRMWLTFKPQVDNLVISKG